MSVCAMLDVVTPFLYLDVQGAFARFCWKESMSSCIWVI